MRYSIEVTETSIATYELDAESPEHAEELVGYGDYRTTQHTIEDRSVLVTACDPGEITKDDCDILIEVHDGVATLVKAPAGMRVIQRDYDTDGSSDEDLERDEAGVACFHDAAIIGSDK